MSAKIPSFSSLALDEQPPPDWTSVTVEAMPPGLPMDPRLWARQVFAGQELPPVVHALMVVRQLLAPLVGIERAPKDVFAVDTVVGDEALIVERERHLDFRCGVGVDVEAGLLRVTTAVWLHGRRGRLYFLPVSVAHDAVTRSMMRAAIRRVAAQQPR